MTSTSTASGTRAGVGARHLWTVVALVGAMTLGSSSGAPARAATGTEPHLVRYAGVDRFDTAVQASRATFPAGSVPTVLLAGAGSTVDALSAAALAGATGSPVLLADSHVGPGTLSEIRRLGAGEVVVVGGPEVVGVAAVEELVHSGLRVRRVAGSDRYETAALLAAALPATPTTVFVAGSSSDAAAAAPLAAATGWPVLLAAGDVLPAATARELAVTPGARVVVLGGTDRVSDAVAERVGASVRIAGADRAATAVELAEFAVDEAGFSTSRVGLAAGFHGATGDDLVDALTAGPVLARTRTPLLLTGPTELGPSAAQHLRSHPGISSLAVFGGTPSVPENVVQQATAALVPVQEPVDPQVPIPAPPEPVVTPSTAPVPSTAPTAEPVPPAVQAPRILAVAYDQPGLPPVFQGFHFGQSLLVVPSQGWRLASDVRLTLDTDGPDASGRYGTGEVHTYTTSTPTAPYGERLSAELLYVDTPYSGYWGELFLSGPQVPAVATAQPGAAVSLEGFVTDVAGSGQVRSLEPAWVPITADFPQ